jgi:hypothetical protein
MKVAWCKSQSLTGALNLLTKLASKRHLATISSNAAVFSKHADIKFVLIFCSFSTEKY